MSNLGSGLFQGIPVSTSLSASSVADGSGAKTQVASLTTGAMVVLTMLFLAPLFSDLPKSVLAAIIIEAVVMGMMDVPEMKRLFRVDRADFWIAIAAIAGVILAGVLAGVIIGVLLSLGALIYVSAVPEMPQLGRAPKSQAFLSLEEHPEAETYPGMLVVRFDAGLYFATCDALEDGLREYALDADPRITTLVLDFEGVNFIDSQGAETLGKIIGLVRNYGADIRLARVKTRVVRMLDNDGVLEQLGEDHIYANVYEAAADFIPEDTG